MSEKKRRAKKINEIGSKLDSVIKRQANCDTENKLIKATAKFNL
jgi:hypothetical protein